MKQPDEYGYRPFNLRGGLSLPPFKGINLEKNQGDLDDEEFSNLINAWIKPTEIINRYGQEKAVTGPQSNEIVGLFDTKIYDGPLGSVIPIPPTVSPGGCSGGSTPSGILFVVTSGADYLLKIYDAALTPTVQTLLTRSSPDSINKLLNIGSKQYILTSNGTTSKFEQVCVSISAGTATATVGDVTPASALIGGVAFAMLDGGVETFFFYRSSNDSVYISSNNSAWAIEFTGPGGSYAFVQGVSSASGPALLYNLTGDPDRAHRIYARSGGSWSNVLTGLPNDGSNITPLLSATDTFIVGNILASDIVLVTYDMSINTVKKWSGFGTFTAQPTWSGSGVVDFARATLGWDANAEEEWLVVQVDEDNWGYGRASAASPTTGTPSWFPGTLHVDSPIYYSGKFWTVSKWLTDHPPSPDPSINLISWSAPFNTGAVSDIVSGTLTYIAVAYA